MLKNDDYNFFPQRCMGKNTPDVSVYFSHIGVKHKDYQKETKIWCHKSKNIDWVG